jgi:ethanolamine transporter EutH
MLSRFSLKWKWYDWLFVIVVVMIIVGAIRVIAPTSGLSQALHQGFHALAVGLQWIASGLSALAQLLGQL